MALGDELPRDGIELRSPLGLLHGMEKIPSLEDFDVKSSTCRPKVKLTEEGERL